MDKDETRIVDSSSGPITINLPRAHPLRTPIIKIADDNMSFSIRMPRYPRFSRNWWTLKIHDFRWKHSKRYRAPWYESPDEIYKLKVADQSATIRYKDGIWTIE